MNAKDRKQLQSILDKIVELKEQLEIIKESEQEKFDNLTEGLQATERGQKLEEGVEQLESAFSSLEEAGEYLEEAINF